MKREVKGLYGQCFQFAFDIAKKAERALQHELGNKDISHLQFGYLAGKEGLLAGEKLYLDIKRMEMGYHENNRREYELTKHISLQQKVHCIDWIGMIDHPNVTKISEKMGLTRGGISRISKRLLGKGLIESYQEPDNNKEIYYQLTESGKIVYDELKKFITKPNKSGWPFSNTTTTMSKLQYYGFYRN